MFSVFLRPPSIEPTHSQLFGSQMSKQSPVSWPRSLCVGLGFLVTVSSVCVASAPGSKSAVAWPRVESAVAKDPRIEARIGELLRNMTLEQKIAQMVQADIRYVTPDDVRKYRL